MKPTLTAIATCVLLSACSFNTINNYSYVTSSEQSRVETVDVVQEPVLRKESSQVIAIPPPATKKTPPPVVVKKVVYGCKGLVFPKLPKAPVSPAPAIEKIDPTNKAAINKALLIYLGELATYANGIKKNYVSVQDTYKVKCGG